MLPQSSDRLPDISNDELGKLKRRVAQLEAQNAEYERSDQVLRAIVEGTAAATSSDFLRLLVRKLAAALKVRYAFITECTDPKPVKQATKLRTLAFWMGQDFGNNFEYAVSGTPCEIVTGEKSCCFYPMDVQALFPDDQDLLDLQAESYIGIPLLDSAGNLMGHLAALDDKPLENREYLESIMQIFTARAAAEMERKQAEEALQESTQQLEKALHDLKQAQLHLVQSEKMSALGQLVAGIAHEINNPVNFIHGNLSPAQQYIQDLLELLQLYQTYFPETPAEIQHKIETIDLEFLQADLVKLLASMQVGTERIREIVQSLRLFSRLDQAEMKAVKIHEGIDSALMLLENRLKATPEKPAITVIKEYGDLPLVECYAGQLNQVFMNVLVNAIDSLESNYEINSSIDNPLDHPEALPRKTNLLPTIKIRTEVLSLDRVCICITDNGLGMDEGIQSQLFNPFFTTKPVGKGTGMGMAVSYQIITEKHKGRINYVSEVGKGTEVSITIPLYQSNSDNP
jgi:two-component system NtrC family sensor kinase